MTFFVITVLCIFFLLYIYFIYPILLLLFCRFWGRKPISDGLDGGCKPTVTLLVPAYNEESVIEKKLVNHLSLDYPKDSYEILVVSDGSFDRTEDIVRKISRDNPERVRLLSIPDRKGKTNAINTAMNTVSSEITIFSDANVLLRADAITMISHVLAEDSVGGVAGQLTYVNEHNSEAAESNGLYWRYEEYIKELESQCGSIMGADGSIFAIKTKLYKKLPLYVLDDFCTSMGVLVQGYSFKFSTSIKAYEKGAESKKEEFSRKVRISNRSFNSYRYMREEFKNLDLFDRWKLISHKIVRWYSIFFMLSALAANILWVLSDSSFFSISFFCLHILFYVFALTSWLGLLSGLKFIGKVSNICQYFLMANLAAGIGITESLLGEKVAVWSISESTR